MRPTFLAIILIPSLALSARAAEPVQKGTIRFQPGEQQNVPECYRLTEHTFTFELDPARELPASGVNVHRLRFPSPVETPHTENNTVHAEYYRPRGQGPFPAVIVLDITGGNQALPRTMATHFAQNRIAGLFVQMAYYGPRRPPGSNLRLMSTDLPHTLAAIRQTVLDLRRASAWLQSRPEIDGRQLGIVGTSLGSFIGTLTAEMEPRLGRVAVLLGGGGLVDAYYDDPRGASLIWLYELTGGTKEKVKQRIAPVDPLTCAANLKDRRVLIMAARRDEIVPPRAAEALWEATGKQKIVWFDCTHYGAVLHIVPALDQLVEHFQ